MEERTISLFGKISLCSQVGFFDIVAMPLFQSFAQAFADATPMLEAVRDNYNMWRDETGPPGRVSASK